MYNANNKCIYMLFLLYDNFNIFYILLDDIRLKFI